MRRPPAPRQLPPEAARWRRSSARAVRTPLSFCCDRDGCRKRVTPPSVRFLGRKVYLGAVGRLGRRHAAGTLAAASPRAFSALRRRSADHRSMAGLFGVSTSRRTPFWKVARGRFMPAVRSQPCPGRFWKPSTATISANAWTAASLSLADLDRGRPGDRTFPGNFPSTRRRRSSTARPAVVIVGSSIRSPDLRGDVMTHQFLRSPQPCGHASASPCWARS